MISRIRIQILISTVITVCFLAFPDHVLADRQSPRLFAWQGLKFGAHGIGYRVVQQYDFGRSFRRDSDYFGNVYRGEKARPVQISIWYPAKKRSTLPRMSYVDYLLKVVNETDFAIPDKAAKQAFLLKWKQDYERRKIPVDVLIELLSEKMNAVENAEASAGPFPLILYAASINSSPYENLFLFEYLASHGYIVAAVPSNGRHSGIMTMDWEGSNAQVDDLAFVLAYMKSDSTVDFERIGALGFSWGGLAVSQLAVKNHLIDGTVCLDGGVRFGFDGNRWKNYPYYRSDKLRSPFMLMSSRGYREATRKDFISRIKYAPVFHLNYPFLQHSKFCSADHQIRLGWIRKQMTDKVNPLNRKKLRRDFNAGKYPTQILNDRIIRSYELLCFYTGAFFDWVLKDDPKGQAVVFRGPARNGYPAELVQYQANAALPVPPNQAEFIQIMQRKPGGLTEAKRLFLELRKKDPELKIFSEAYMNNLGYRLLHGNRIDEAISVLELNAIAYPNSANVYDSLGEAYAAGKAYQKAIRSYQRSLELDRTNANAVKMLRKLKGKDD